jgi:hypothetical protein
VGGGGFVSFFTGKARRTVHYPGANLSVKIMEIMTILIDIIWLGLYDNSRICIELCVVILCHHPKDSHSFNPRFYEELQSDVEGMR